jgi:hypothetical protein
MITNMLYIMQVLADVSAANPPVALDINWTFLISVFAICLTAFGTIVKTLGGRNKIDEETLEKSHTIKGIIEKVSDSQREIRDIKTSIMVNGSEINAQTKKLEADILMKLKDMDVGHQENKINLLKLQHEVSTNRKSIEDQREAQKEAAKKIDNLMQKFLEYINSLD